MTGFAYSFPVQVSAPAVQDQYGDRTLASARTVPGCVVYPSSSGEQHDYRDTVTTGLTMFAPVGADIRARDVVVLPAHPHVPVHYQGTRWRVEGEPASWSSPYTGWQAGVVVTLERVTG